MFPSKNKTSEFLHYLAEAGGNKPGEARIPPLKKLSEVLAINIARLREQLEVARALGLVDVSPRTGIKRRSYSFFPAVQQSLAYAIELDRTYFDWFAELRNHVEMAYWHEAVSKLQPEDQDDLQALVDSAWSKLRSPQIQIPHQEHRKLHLSIYQRLNNPFVIGILEAYWDAYEAIGFNLYTGYEYLHTVWQYHQKMVECIRSGDVEEGFQALVEHNHLIHHHPLQAPASYSQSISVKPSPSENY